MTPERRASLAKGLAKNTLLPKLFDEFADDLREQWETTKTDEAETRERIFVELKTLDNLRDSIYAKLNGGDATT